jgi:hypothetical protein
MKIIKKVTKNPYQLPSNTCTGPVLQGHTKIGNLNSLCISCDDSTSNRRMLRPEARPSTENCHNGNAALLEWPVRGQQVLGHTRDQTFEYQFTYHVPCLTMGAKSCLLVVSFLLAHALKSYIHLQSPCVLHAPSTLILLNLVINI